jgi:hypothetical protein
MWAKLFMKLGELLSLRGGWRSWLTKTEMAGEVIVPLVRVGMLLLLQ